MCVGLESKGRSRWGARSEAAKVAGALLRRMLQISQHVALQVGNYANGWTDQGLARWAYNGASVADLRQQGYQNAGGERAGISCIHLPLSSPYSVTSGDFVVDYHKLSSMATTGEQIPRKRNLPSELITSSRL